MRRGYASLCYVAKRLAVCLALTFGMALSPAHGEPLRLVVLGDSLAAGYGLPEADSFTVQLEAALQAEGLDVVVQNAGVSGDTTAGGWARLEWALADGADAMIVELGANDMLRGIDPGSSRANLEAILHTLQQRDIPALLAGMRAPQNLGQAYVDAFEAMYADIAGQYHAVFYPFFLEGVAGNAALNQDDLMHPNAAGVAIIVKTMLPSVVELLDRVERMP